MKRDKCLEAALFCFLIAAVLSVALFLGGCTVKNTSIRVPQTAEVGTSQTRETTIKTPDSGTVTITQTITMSDSAVKTETDQDADADVPIALGMPGSTPASSVGNLVQEGVESSNTVPVVVTPKDTTTTTTTTNTVPVVVPAVTPGSEAGADPAATDVDLLDYSFETHDLKHLHDDESRKLFRWMDHTGAYYGKNIIVKFSDGDTWLITDGGQQQGGDGTTSNHNQKFWFSGNPEQQDDTNMGCEGGCASIFPEPDSKAETVTLYYKK